MRKLKEILARKKEIKELLSSNAEVNLEELEVELKGLDEEMVEIEKRNAMAEKINSNHIEARTIEKPEAKKEERKIITRKDLGSNEIKEFGDFLQEVRFNQHNTKLEQRTLQMGVGAAGGFIVPEQFDNNIRMVQDNEAIFRPRAQVIPAGSPPDSAVTIPALDQSGANGVYSGVNVVWIGEGDEKPETEPSFREIKLEPHEVAAHVVVTDKLLRNSAAAGALVMSLLRKAIVAAEEDAFFTGNGIGRPLGIIGHPASINVNRAVANQIAYADIVAMYARLKMSGKGAWICTQTALPQLMTLVDGGGRLIWQPNARDGAPGTLLGLPVYINDQSPILGAQGDLSLVDLDYYLIKDGSGISISMSEHPRFTRNQTIIKAFWNVDGQPWLTTPLLQRDGVSTVSPFVVLN